tara:strand:- start:7853 stop:8146 length:294 start_codon:yes stop_codon:yes gene_type:complete
MINNFWFYFFITPVLISIISLNSLFVHKSSSTPVFENALEYCQKIDNNYVYSDQGTAQDICIDEYMNAPWAFKLVIKIFLLFVFIFLVPLLLYIKNR